MKRQIVEFYYPAGEEVKGYKGCDIYAFWGIDTRGGDIYTGGGDLLIYGGRIYTCGGRILTGGGRIVTGVL